MILFLRFVSLTTSSKTALATKGKKQNQNEKIQLHAAASTAIITNKNSNIDNVALETKKNEMLVMLIMMRRFRKNYTSKLLMKVAKNNVIARYAVS